MNFFDVVTTQRAMRRLEPDPIPDALSGGSWTRRSARRAAATARAGASSWSATRPRARAWGSSALIPLGDPLGTFGRPPRRPIGEVTFADRWGRAFPSEGRRMSAEASLAAVPMACRS
jgi:hypothetical protein